MTEHALRHRAFQRLLGRAEDDLGSAERFYAGRSRVQVANDPMRRDAMELCLRRVATIASHLAELDEEARRVFEPALTMLQPLRMAGCLDRMDSDVLCGLVGICSLDLRPAIDALRRRRSPS